MAASRYLLQLDFRQVTPMMILFALPAVISLATGLLSCFMFFSLASGAVYFFVIGVKNNITTVRLGKLDTRINLA